MAAGERVGCAVVIAAFQLAILGIFAVATATGAGMLLAAAGLVLHVDLILLAASNFVFLIYPVRTSTPASFDVNRLGHGFLSLLLQMIFSVPLVGLPPASPPPRTLRAACRSQRRSSGPCSSCGSSWRRCSCSPGRRSIGSTRPRRYPRDRANQALVAARGAT
jgi:hypothetical protein